MVPRLALSVLLLLAAVRAGPVAGPSDRRLRGAVPDLRPGRGDDVDAVGGAATDMPIPPDAAAAGAAPPHRRLPDALRRPRPRGRGPAGRRRRPGDRADRAARRGRHQHGGRGGGARLLRGAGASRRAASAPRASGGASTSGRSRPRAALDGATALARAARVRLPLPGGPLMRGVALALAAAVAACTAGPPLPPQPERCEALFLRYDAAVRHYPNSWFDEDGTILRAGPGLPRQPGADQQRLPDPLRRPRRPAGALRAAAAVPDRDRRAGDPAGAGAPRHRHRDQRRGPGHPLSSAASATARAASAPRASDGGLHRTVHHARARADQALAVAREAGFIAPYVAKYTRF